MESVRIKPKLLFICPTSKGINALPLPPLGMLWIAAYLRQRGILVDAIDTYIDPEPEKLRNKLEWCDIACITCPSSHQFTDAKRIGELAKSLNKMTVFGGVHATVRSEESAHHFDIVVRGEGEVTMLEIANHYPNDFTHIAGISYYKDGRVYHNEKRQFISDLDTIPFPARDLIPPTRYPYRELKRFSGRYTSMLTSRGCPNRCIFCASPAMWGFARLRSPENVFAEMMEIYNKWGIKNIHFHDDTFTLSREHVIRLCHLIINSGIGFKWSCITRPDKVDRELMKLMKEAGCVQIEIGAESASDKLLAVAKKNYKTADVKRAFALAREAGLNTYAYFIIGLPGETLWTWLKTIWYAKRLKLNSCVFTVLSPFPGTEAAEKGMVKVLQYDCWLYKRPVIRLNWWMGPRALMIMRKIADILVNGFGYHGAYVKKQDF